MTLKEAQEFGRAQLLQANIPDPAIDAWYLLEFVTRVNRAAYFGNPDRVLTPEEEACYQQLVARRSQRIPLQHLTGVQEFMGYVFQVNEHVLIPRQDTECLVEQVLEWIPPDADNLEVLDLCTGSGCILISLMGLRPQIQGVGVDISPEALEVAKRNGIHNQVDPTWIQSDLFAKVTGTFDIIVSNPPYIRTAEIEALEAEVKEHDPLLALDGKEDGLFFYHAIIEQAPQYLKKNGMLAFEIGHDQGESVSEYMKLHGFVDVEVKKDLAGLDRIVYGHVQ